MCGFVDFWKKLYSMRPTAEVNISFFSKVNKTTYLPKQKTVLNVLFHIPREINVMENIYQNQLYIKRFFYQNYTRKSTRRFARWISFFRRWICLFIQNPIHMKNLLIFYQYGIIPNIHAIIPYCIIHVLQMYSFSMHCNVIQYNLLLYCIVLFRLQSLHPSYSKISVS